MKDLQEITIDEKPARRAHCTFCGGRGDSLKAETVLSNQGLRYRIPANHISCKESVLSLSLDETAQAETEIQSNQERR